MIQKIVCSVCGLNLMFMDDDYVINKIHALCEKCFKNEGKNDYN